MKILDRENVLLRPLMTVWDIRITPGRGVAVSGVNSELDSLSEDEIYELIPSEVVIETTEFVKLRIRIADKEVVSSISGKKNIHILLSQSDGIEKIRIGSPVWM